MFKKVFGFVLLLLMHFTAMSQDAALDRIMQLADDTVKVHKLATLAKEVVHQDSKKARKLSELVLTISKKLQYDDGIGLGYSYLGFIDGNEGKFRSSIEQYNQSIHFYSRSHNNSGIAKCLGNVSAAYESLGKSDSSVIIRLKAIELLEKELQKKIKSTENSYLLSMQYFNMAVSNDKFFGNNQKTFSYFRKAEALARQIDDTFMIVSSLGGITELYIREGKNKEAMPTAKEVLRLVKNSDDFMLKALGYDVYAQALSAANELDASIEASRTAVKYGKLAGAIEENISQMIHLSSTLKKKGDYKAQIDILQDVLAKSLEIGQIEFIGTAYDALAEAYFKLGNFEKAYHFLNKRIIYKDSAFKKENSKIIAELEIKYQTEKKEKALSEKELQIVKKDLDLQKSKSFASYMFAGFVIVLLLSVILYINYQNKRKMHKRELEALHQAKELQLLQALMQGEEKERSRIAKDLHDGVAGMLAAVKMHLNSIAFQNGGVLQSEGFMQGVKLLDEATLEVRKTSHNLMPELLLQHGLDEALSRYCRSISNKNLLVQYDSWGDIQRYKEGFELSVYRVVQELLNNILKHSEATHAVVQMSCQEGLLSITVEDNGVGFDKTTMQVSGMGLHSLERRVQSINGKIDIQAEAGNGVCAYLEFDTAGLQKESSRKIASM